MDIGGLSVFLGCAIPSQQSRVFCSTQDECMDEVLVYDGLQSCPYLPGQVARMPLYRQTGRLTPEEVDVQLAESRRRVGFCLYKTECPTCNACEGIRVLVNEFSPTRSQRRVLAKWEATGRVEFGPVSNTPEKFDLYRRHKTQRKLSQKEDGEFSEQAYENWLVLSCMPSMEMRYYLGSKCVGIAVLDLGSRAASAVYTYFDPDPEVARYSPGVFSVLQQIQFCRQSGRDFLYLGLYVGDCKPLRYKANYHPHERLHKGVWCRDVPSDSSSGE
jgi:arginyl-tRNA--protein-N-Asp/Glu arginylyltransferase